MFELDIGLNLCVCVYSERVHITLQHIQRCEFLSLAISRMHSTTKNVKNAAATQHIIGHSYMAIMERQRHTITSKTRCNVLIK